ncbi:MAG TPA: hypothetical protein EYN67_07545 [Flavobacteriales bacterium]|nr:hypothetical protein [Flavobacteriales bacterium]
MKLKIHMKSGKTLVERGVKDFNLTYGDKGITQLEIILYWYHTRTVIMGALDLACIESITRH